MEASPLEIQMLGEFSLHTDLSQVSDSNNRAKKVWLLLAYMIYNRHRPISFQEMADLLWSGEESRANPFNALKTILHRVRSTLDLLWEGAGHQLILRQDASYMWDPNIPVHLDIDDFEALLRKGAQAKTPKDRIHFLQEAHALYQGDFLPKLSSELWVVSLSSHYRSLYVDTALELLSLLETQADWENCVSLCQASIRQDPYIEQFYRYQMQALLQLQRQQEAVTVYEEMSELFLSEFGVMPSEDLLALYRMALQKVNKRTVSSGTILEQLREPPDQGGALMCDYDVFKTIYHSLARSVIRSGDTAHLALISILPQKGRELSRRSLDTVVENLRELLRLSLRRGDVAARCSASQYILLLPQANFENSGMVCQRLIRTFTRQYPHSPARLHTSIHPLQPNE